MKLHKDACIYALTVLKESCPTFNPKEIENMIELWNTVTPECFDDIKEHHFDFYTSRLSDSIDRIDRKENLFPEISSIKVHFLNTIMSLLNHLRCPFSNQSSGETYFQKMLSLMQAQYPYCSLHLLSPTPQHIIAYIHKKLLKYRHPKIEPLDILSCLSQSHSLKERRLKNRSPFSILGTNLQFVFGLSIDTERKTPVPRHILEAVRNLFLHFQPLPPFFQTAAVQVVDLWNTMQTKEENGCTSLDLLSLQLLPQPKLFDPKSSLSHLINGSIVYLPPSKPSTFLPPQYNALCHSLNLFFAFPFTRFQNPEIPAFMLHLASRNSYVTLNTELHCFVSGRYTLNLYHNADVCFGNSYCSPDSTVNINILRIELNKLLLKNLLFRPLNVFKFNTLNPKIFQNKNIMLGHLRQLKECMNRDFIFHGTPLSSVINIIKLGFYESSQGKFGKGVYFATDINVSNMYANPRGTTSGIIITYELDFDQLEQMPLKIVIANATLSSAEVQWLDESDVDIILHLPTTTLPHTEILVRNPKIIPQITNFNKFCQNQIQLYDQLLKLNVPNSHSNDIFWHSFTQWKNLHQQYLSAMPLQS